MNEKGAIMPVILMLCFLFSALLLFHISMYINDKQNVLREEQVLTLEWLLRNAEQQWTNEKEALENGEQTISFPRGTVRVEQTRINEENIRVDLTANDKKGNERTHYFNIQSKEDRSSE
ncbi:hypothetical protein D7Z54_23570 [Salibacterium salarium]|uniref:Competence protein ComGG n=1 Tax=Salibacterium salarium TaxID=284579 RepID=A0A428MXT6_9BACI|nr:competence type IV pilus minor pilin ComGG [Salibacterium salarium]RSL30945.1 hypothetical protein D7Z54_23570 [Salibacterium salarium]